MFDLSGDQPPSRSPIASVEQKTLLSLRKLQDLGVPCKTVLSITSLRKLQGF